MEASTGLLRRRERVLEAGERLFSERGYRAVGVDDIGAAAGISGPAVYRHFPSKGALLQAICHDAMETLLVGAAQIVAQAGADAGSCLRRLVSFHAEFAVRDRRLLEVYVREQRELPPDALRLLRRRQRDYERLWQATLQRLRDDLSREEVEMAITAALSLLNATPHAGERFAQDRLRGLLERMALAALLAPPLN